MSSPLLVASARRTDWVLPPGHLPRGGTTPFGLEGFFILGLLAHSLLLEARHDFIHGLNHLAAPAIQHRSSVCGVGDRIRHHARKTFIKDEAFRQRGHWFWVIGLVPPVCPNQL